MSAKSTTCKIVLRILLYTFLAVVVWGLLHAYHTIRTERVRTRLSMRMSEGEHEVVVSLPSGGFQIHFTAEPNVGPASVVYYGRHMLPAVITTRLARRDGSFIVEPTTKEYITFSMEGDDLFRPQRLLVSITKTQDCQIYMNLAPGF
jgi:hypothetical protein